MHGAAARACLASQSVVVLIDDALALTRYGPSYFWFPNFLSSVLFPRFFSFTFLALAGLGSVRCTSAARVPGREGWVVQGGLRLLCCCGLLCIPHQGGWYMGASSTPRGLQAACAQPGAACSACAGAKAACRVYADVAIGPMLPECPPPP